MPLHHRGICHDIDKEPWKYKQVGGVREKKGLGLQIVQSNAICSLRIDGYHLFTTKWPPVLEHVAQAEASAVAD